MDDIEIPFVIIAGVLGVEDEHRAIGVCAQRHQVLIAGRVGVGAGSAGLWIDKNGDRHLFYSALRDIVHQRADFEK